MILGITGGIGSGKSYVCKSLIDRGIPVFYTDDEARAEMRDNPIIHQQLVSLIGPEAIAPDGTPSKPVLRNYICQGPDNAAKVNAIVHPKVKERTARWCAAHTAAPVVAIECALLFESGFQDLCDQVVTISAPLEVRISRVCQRDGITPAKAREWIALQMPQEEKERLADHTIINDGIQPLAPQIDRILNS